MLMFNLVFFLCVDHLKIFIEFVAALLLLYVCLCFGYEACGILALRPYLLHWEAKS